MFSALRLLVLLAEKGAHPTGPQRGSGEGRREYGAAGHRVGAQHYSGQTNTVPLHASFSPSSITQYRLIVINS